MKVIPVTRCAHYILYLRFHKSWFSGQSSAAAANAIQAIWLTATKYQYFKWQWIFYFLRRRFFPLSLPRIWPDLTIYEYKYHGVFFRGSSNCLPFASTWVLPRCFIGIRFAHRFTFLCCPIMCLYVLGSVLWCPLRGPHKRDILDMFVFTSSYL